MNNQEAEDNSTPKTNGNRSVVIVLLVILAIAIIGLVVVALTHHKSTNSVTYNSSTSITPAQVSITSSGFAPQAISIKVGQAVVWTNNDKSVHQIASDPYPKDNNLSSLNSINPIASGHAYSYVFKTAGTYTYHDNLNPYTFKGTVVVK